MRGPRALVWLVVFALLAATAIATLRAWRVERREADEANGALARQAAGLAQQEVALLAAGVRGGEAVLTDSGDVDSDRFASFAAGVLRPTTFLGLAYAPLTSAAERAGLERELGRLVTELGPRGSRPAGERELLAPITAIYPPRGPTGSLLGLDLLSEPLRRQAALAARATGVPRLTAPLAEASTGDVGATIFSPVYQPGADPGSSPTGFFAAAVTGERIERWVSRRLESSGPVQILDSGTVLAGPRAMPADSMSHTVHVLGRDWTVSVAPAMTADVRPAVGFAVGGLALSALAASLFWIAGRRERELRDRRAAAELLAARESLLTRIAEAVEREIEVGARLASLARTLVPAVGEVCVVYVVTAERSVRRAGIASTHPEVERVLAAMGTPAATSPIRAAISSRQPVLYTRVSAGREGRGPQPERGPWPPSDEADLRANVSSSMIVPLIARERVLGAISLAMLRGGGRPAYTREDLAFVTEVASHAAVALDNARLYEQQRDIAGILQSALLPPSLPQPEGLEVAARHRPGLDGTEVGGDFYDLFEIRGRWVAVVGDVCGKGPEAAALTALVRHTLRATAGDGPELAVRRVHDAISSSGELTYCTLCCAELELGEHGINARITTAGHPEPRIVAVDGTVRRLEVTGPLVGALDTPTYLSQSVHLAPGEVLFMCSDGVPEARRNGEMFGDERLEALLGSFGAIAPADLIARLEEEVVRFIAGRQRDDLALFALRARR